MRKYCFVRPYEVSSESEEETMKNKAYLIAVHLSAGLSTFPIVSLVLPDVNELLVVSMEC